MVCVICVGGNRTEFANELRRFFDFIHRVLRPGDLSLYRHAAAFHTIREKGRDIVIQLLSVNRYAVLPFCEGKHIRIGGGRIEFRHMRLYRRNIHLFGGALYNLLYGIVRYFTSDGKVDGTVFIVHDNVIPLGAGEAVDTAV